MSENSVLLQVQNLKVSFRTPAGIVQAVRGVSFNLNQGETLAIVGESGCGKSVTARTVMGLTHRPGIIDPESHILFEGQDILRRRYRIPGCDGFTESDDDHRRSDYRNTASS